jgi:hypothetical protein
MIAGLSNNMETLVVPKSLGSEVRKAFFELIFPDVRLYNLDQFFPKYLFPFFTSTCTSL